MKTFTFSYQPSNYSFNGQERDDEIYGDGNAIGFEARILDPRLGRWLSIDPLFAKYPDVNPYNSALCNPLYFEDPDGRDIVYFGMDGKETHRVVDEKTVKTFVAIPIYTECIDPKTGQPEVLGYDYQEAAMPSTISGYEDPKYQQYDYVIAAETFIFNYKKNEMGEVPEYTNGTVMKDAKDKVPDLNPTLVKAIAIKETQMGNFDPNLDDLNDSKKDIMQANVYFSETKTDWNDSKKQFGLTKNGGVLNAQQSIKAGIGILYQKGLKNGDGKKWTGGKDWGNAVENYNGNGKKDANNLPHKVNYKAAVMKMFYNSTKKVTTNDVKTKLTKPNVFK